MKKTVLSSILSVAIAFLFAGTPACSKKTGPEVADALMVIYTSRASTVTRENKTIPLSPGFLLKNGDTIKTGNGTVDIQSRSGSIIRIRSYSNMTVDSLLKSPTNKTKLTLNEGAMLAKIKKLSSDDEYTVHTPTAIAGVRGTTFSVELQDSGEPTVRVYEGSVSVKPNIMALEEKTPENIKSNPELQELKKLQDNQEVILESETEASMNKDVNNIIKKINTDMSKESFSKEGKDDNAKNSDVLKLSEKTSFEKIKAPVTPKESSELATLAAVDDELVLNMMDKTVEESDTKNSQIILENYNKNMDESIKAIESSTNLKSDEDIKNFYTIVEEVVRKNGNKKIGAVVTQIGDKVIFHSQDGVSQIQIEEIDHIDYHTK